MVAPAPRPGDTPAAIDFSPRSLQSAPATRPACRAVPRPACPGLFCSCAGPCPVGKKSLTEEALRFCRIGPQTFLARGEGCKDPRAGAGPAGAPKRPAFSGLKRRSFRGVFC